jgi:hypothetical protein
LTSGVDFAAGTTGASGVIIVVAAAGLLFNAVLASAQDFASAATAARAEDGSYIGWREHLVDDQALSGVELRGADGLEIADLDADGYLDIVSVHESDDQYDGVAEGHIRIAFGSADPDVWQLVTLADGAEAGAAEDVAIGDVNGDGLLDVIAACELSHLIYFQNPGREIRNGGAWQRLIPSVTQDRGSFIRVFLADLNGDGRLEVTTANKGAQDPTRARQEPKEISFFEIVGEPLDDGAWREHVLTRVPWPINAQPVDLDGDGDLDIVAGSVAERRMMWFENDSREDAFAFTEHPIEIVPADAPIDGLAVHGFNMDYVDLNRDGRLDIVTLDTPPLIGTRLIWLEQPARSDLPWAWRLIADYSPDSVVGIRVADIDDDGDPDVMTGGYSGVGVGTASRSSDVPTPAAALGRLAWFENEGNAERWREHSFSRRQRGMFDKFIALDMDHDGDVDFAGTRGNSGRYDGVFWLEQVRSASPRRAFEPARASESPEVPMP